jgi:exopolysaccharide biosynthesis polyprenyl glycosylphosphotransferase
LEHRPLRVDAPPIAPAALTASASPGVPHSRPACERIANRDALGRHLLAASDTAAAAFALLFGISLIGHDRLLPAALLGVLLVVPISKAVGLYDRDEVVIRHTTIDEAPAIFQLATLYTLAFSLLAPTLALGTLGREQTVGLWAMFGIAALAGRFLVRSVADRVLPAERCLLIGDVQAAAQLEGPMLRSGSRAELVGRMDTTYWTGPVSYGELSGLIEDNRLDRIIVVPDDAHPQSVLDLIRAAKGLGVRVSVLPRVLEVVGSNIEFDNLGGVPLLGVRPLRLSRSSRMTKRCFDIVVASFLLLVVAPVLAGIALAIVLDTRGRVFFRQTRIGRDGASFRIFKFRTMVSGAEAMKAQLAHLNQADGLFKMADDPRITRVGRFLRRTSLDELPQLLNVLRGEMSLVGPRPLIADEDSQITGFDRRRLNLTPGMTGHWQILGSARVPLCEMVKIDYLYVAGWSLWADVKLLLRTIPYVLSRRGQ